MNFDFSDDLKALREQARKFLRERCPVALVRRILDGPEPYDRGLFKENGRARPFRKRWVARG
jgi:acyl-CoA dehydrogenase